MNDKEIIDKVALKVAIAVNRRFMGQVSPNTFAIGEAIAEAILYAREATLSDVSKKIKSHELCKTYHITEIAGAKREVTCLDMILLDMACLDSAYKIEAKE